MWGQAQLQQLVQMLAYLGFDPAIYPEFSVVLGQGESAAPGAAGELLASNGPAANPSFQTLTALGIQPALGYIPAHSGANTDITSLNAPALGAATATTPAVGTSTTRVATTAFVVNHSPIPNILDFGGDPTGANDNSAAFAAALGAGIGGHPAIYFPPGIYKFSGNVSYTLPNSTSAVSIIGAGPEITQLYWPGGGGLSINYIGAFNSAHIRDLSILTGSSGVGNGIALNQTAASIGNPANSALSDITNVTVRGFDGYAAVDYWVNGIIATGVSNINFTGVMVAGNNAAVPTGTGLVVTGSASLPPVVFNVTGCTLNNLSTGFYYGNYVQGVTIAQSNFTYVTNSILVPSSQTNLDQLTVVGNQFGMPPNASAGVSINTWVPFTMISNNLFFINGTDSGVVGISGLMTITGNSFHGDGAGSANGVVITSTNSTNASVVTGNAFNSLASGIFLQAASKSMNVQSNAYSSNTTNVTNSGTGNTIGGGSQ